MRVSALSARISQTILSGTEPLRTSCRERSRAEHVPTAGTRARPVAGSRRSVVTGNAMVLRATEAESRFICIVPRYFLLPIATDAVLKKADRNSYSEFNNCTGNFYHEV